MIQSKETQEIVEQAVEYAKSLTPPLRKVSLELLGWCLLKKHPRLAPQKALRWKEILHFEVLNQSKHPKGRPTQIARKSVGFANEVNDLFRRCHNSIVGREQAIRPPHIYVELFDRDHPLLDMDVLTDKYIDQDLSMLVRELVEKFGGSEPKNPSEPKIERPDVRALVQFCRNVTSLAKMGMLDPVIGREREIRKTIQVLLKRKKNSPILIGEAGVGKTAIVEGLAQRLLEIDSPLLEGLLNREIYELDMMSLIGGAEHRGALEKRLKELVQELSAQKGQYILFIDEIHNMVGAGNAKGAADIANFLKPALARGEIQVIGATTLLEYKKFIEPDPALMRRFDRVLIPEPSSEETGDILRQTVGIYEEAHNITYHPDVLDVIPALAVKYYPETHLPDSAINLLDKLGASMKQQISIAPELNSEVDMEQLAKLVEDDKGVPHELILQSPAQRMATFPEFLKQELFGQEDVKETVVRVFSEFSLGIQRTRGVSSSSVVSILFEGPKGSGKTHLADLIASFLFPNKKEVMEFDLSHYTDTYTAQSLKGPPAGIVGYEKGGILTEFVKHHPHCMLIFDNVEQASLSVLSMLEDAFAEGYFKDADNIEYALHNAVIILCSRTNQTQELQRLENLKGLGNVCRFSTLGKDDLCKIMKQEIQYFQKDYKRRGFDLFLPENTLEVLLTTRTEIENAHDAQQFLEETFFSVVPVLILQEGQGPGKYKVTYEQGSILSLQPFN